MDEIGIANIENEAGPSKHINVLDEMITQLAEVNGNSTNSEMQNLRHFGKVIQTQIPESCQPSGSPRAVVNEEHSGAHLFLDTNEIYRNVLLNRLKSLLQVDSLKGIIDHDFNSADVRWNCERVGTKGIVRVQPENDYLTNYVITMMRYLSRWPFDTKFAESSHVPYEGFELNVFKSVCGQFDKDCPMLPNPVALSILHIIQLFRQRSFQQRNSAELHKETVFCADTSPFTRYVQKTVNSQVQYTFPHCARNISILIRYAVNHNKVIHGSDESSNLRTTVSSSNGFINEEHVMTPPNNTIHSSVSTLSADNESFSRKMAYEAILTGLPGLQRSPELMQRIEELTKTHSSVLSSRIPYVESCTILAGYYFDLIFIS
ncbi:unnamed protein product, partial [Onchocerca flexuosa]|uniref:LisH domain-containing protein n=1 Tax=Onchocerca flexuosa TaxID=387005 RepID=A0A183HFP7_9BILA